PPVLYRQAEDRRYGRARGALQAEIRAYRRQGRLGPVLGSGTQRQLRAARPPKGSPRAAFCLQAAGERSAAMLTSAKSAAAIPRITRIGHQRVTRSPSRTAGTLAHIMPSVVPASTAQNSV